MKYRKSKNIVLSALVVVVMMLVAVTASAGVIKAEKEVISENGEIEDAVLVPKVNRSALAYTTDEVLYKTAFDSQGDWSAEAGEFNITESELHIWSNTDRARLESSDANINASSDVYLEARVTLGYYSGDAIMFDIGNTDEYIRFFPYNDATTEYRVTYTNDTGETHDLDITNEDAYTSNETRRFGFSIGTDGSMEVSVFYDNYTEIDSVSATNLTLSSSDIEHIILRGAKGGVTANYYDYLFVTQSGTSPTKTYTPSTDDTEQGATDKYNRKRKIDYEEFEPYGRSGMGGNFHQIDGRELVDNEGKRYLTGKDVMGQMAQTPEENNSYDDHRSYLQGWNDVKASTEDKLVDYIKNKEKVSSYDVTLIDYRVDDVVVDFGYTEEMTETLRETWTDAFFEEAKEYEWKLALDDNKNDTWSEYEGMTVRTDGVKWYSTQRIANDPVLMDLFQVAFTGSTIQDVAQNWNKEQGRSAVTYMRQSNVVPATMSFDEIYGGWFNWGKDSEYKAFESNLNLDEPLVDLGESIPSIAKGFSDINTDFNRKWVEGQKVYTDSLGGVVSDSTDAYKNFTSMFANSAGDFTNAMMSANQAMKDQTISMMGMHAQSVNDVQDDWKRTLDDSQDWYNKQSARQERMFQATNSLLADTVGGLNNSLAGAQDTTERIMLSLLSMDSMFQNDDGEDVFNYQDDDTGKLLSSPLSLETANKINMTTVVIIVAVVGIVLVVLALWKNGSLPGQVR